MENKFLSRKKRLNNQINQVLEQDIFNLLSEAESYLETNPRLGLPLLRQAEGLYILRSYDFNIECRINDVFRSYMKKGL